MFIKKLGLSLLLAVAFLSCEPEAFSPEDTTPFALKLPEGFPAPAIPEDNALTEARVALGKRLFYDPVLSSDSSISCQSCHRQELAFADDRPISPGVQGRLGFRNSPTLANVAYLSRINKDGGVTKLDLQAIVPIEDHAEMDFSILLAAERLNAMPTYEAAFAKAYGEPASPFTITRALGSFMRTMISGHSRYDIAQQGGAPLSAAEARGEMLFFSSRTQCSTCHSGFNFTQNQFLNNGLYLEYEDGGRHRVTLQEEDMGKFRVPTLRNISVTAPYMHDGSLADLRAVVQHYNQGGKGHANQDPRVKPLGLSEQEQNDLIAFLQTLTDTAFLTDEQFR